ncbi:hypothetical protein ABK040_016268 [Willaertia magna]
MPFSSWAMNKLYTFGNKFYDLALTKQTERIKEKFEHLLKKQPPFERVEKKFVDFQFLTDHSDKKIQVNLEDNFKINLQCINGFIWKISFIRPEKGEYPSIIVDDKQVEYNTLEIEEETAGHLIIRPKTDKATYSKIKIYKDQAISLDILSSHVNTENNNIEFLTIFRDIKFSVRTENLLDPVHINYGYYDNGFSDWYGLGQKSGSVKKKGHKYMFWNWDSFGHVTGSDPLYQSIPFGVLSTCIEKKEGEKVLSKERLFNGLFIDNYGFQQWDLTDSDQFNAILQSQPCNCYFICNNTKNPSEITKSYEYLTGKNQMVPLWVLGYHQCRWSYCPDSEVQSICQGFREKDIPCDVMYLDIDYMEGYRDFTWSKENFPNPKEFLQWCHDRKFKVVTILDPGVKIDDQYDVYISGVNGNHFCKYENSDKLYVGSVWPGPTNMPDYTNDAVRKWWGDWYKTLIDVGVDGFWNDMNCPSVKDSPVSAGTMDDNVLHLMDAPYPSPQLHKDVHNLYGSLMAVASREGIEKFQRPLNRRSFLFARACFAGIQKVAGTWTEMLIGLSISGQLMVGADIGGFRYNCFPELYARWIQFGAIFYPYCRTHTDKFTVRQEPWSFGEEVENIARKYIKLRYQLMPLLYTLATLTHKTSEPMIKPLFYVFPQDDGVYESKWEDTQAMLGSNILVAPVLTEGHRKRQIYLPKLSNGSVWHDFFFPEMTFEGGQVITVDAALDSIPIFVRSGTIIPMRSKSADSVYELHLVPIEYKVFGNADPEVKNYLYLDDGISLDYEKGEFGLYEIIDGSGQLKLLEGNGYPSQLIISEEVNSTTDNHLTREAFDKKFY